MSSLAMSASDLLAPTEPPPALSMRFLFWELAGASIMHTQYCVFVRSGMNTEKQTEKKMLKKSTLNVTSSSGERRSVIMDDDKLAFEAMMNEISDSDSDSEFDVRGITRESQGKHTHSEHSHFRESKGSKRDYDYPVSFKEDSKATSEGGARDFSSISKINAPLSTTVSDHQLDIDNFGAKDVRQTSAVMGVPATAQHLDFIANKSWLMKACHPHDPTTQCYMTREKRLGGALILRLYIEPKNDCGEHKEALLVRHYDKSGQLTCVVAGPKFVMSAKKISNKRTSYYLVSVLPEPEDRGGEDVVGKVMH